MNKEPINIPHVPEDACLCRACIPRDQETAAKCAGCYGRSDSGMHMTNCTEYTNGLSDENGSFVTYQEEIVPKVFGTTVEVKRLNFPKFAGLISNQFNHGGDKYNLPGFTDREATDVISSVFGGSSQFDWILGTMMKYLFRFKNFQREKDLLKVATYCYILWLKQGNHLKDTNDEDTSR